MGDDRKGAARTVAVSDADGTSVSPSPESAVPAEPHLGYQSPFRSGGAMRWRRVFPGVDPQLREVRRWLTGLLPDRTAREDLITIAVEYAANAIAHTASGWDGGFFAAELSWHRSIVRIATADGGGPQHPRVLDCPYSGSDGYDEHGLGLSLVQALAVRTGVIGDSNGRVVWAEVPWPTEPATAEAAFEHAHEDVITAAEDDLRTEFGEFLSWYGRETLQWWACPKRAGASSIGLVTAPSAGDLAELLSRVRRDHLAQKP